MSYRLLFPIALTLALAGCMGGTAALREKPAGVHTFEVQGALAEVANAIHAQARRCYSGGTYMPSGVQTSQTQASLQLDEAKGRAQIDVTLHGALGPQTWLLMDLRRIDSGRTGVEVLYARSGYERRAKAVERWIKEGYEKCR
ncbi:hypothetical protein [Aquimonas voraii]|uniref:Lipoprotein n=1 Tax=Aquimonas voraii TaxID=265719 RepID=A0A1G6VXC8_9GAMM|nr:hypothetical protein [Aquimonas voraii]SDD58218.1 hypothetical protein SAMN04488509_1046 [Aquimonas voraii]